jgi:hypothetical protein
MGIFSENVRRYYEHGLVVIPCKDKRPILGKDWQKFCDIPPDDKLIDRWESAYSDVNQLGLAFGKSTFLSGFDFDYEYNERKCSISEKEFQKDRKLVERQLLSILPPTPCIKVGRKGWTRIYRSHGSLENAQCDRNNVRLFDFMARNKQTIIPPSKYSDDSDIVYRWIGDPIEECMDDIPFITQDMVSEIKMLFGEGVEDNSRHGLLFRWIVRQCVIDTDVNVIAKKAVEFDRASNPSPYLSDKKHNPTDDAFANALAWVKRIVRWRDSKPKGSGDYELMATCKNSSEMYFQFFSDSLGKHKVDIITDRLMKFVTVKSEYNTVTSRWRPVDNMVRELRAGVRDLGLKHEPVEDYLASYKKTLVPGLLLDIPAWDGVDRLGEICRLTCPVNVPSVEIYLDVMRHISAGIFRRCFDSMEQNLFTIIRGPQGSGKNYFIEHVFARPFGHYSAEVNVGNDQAKNYDAVEGRLVCVIGEFDQTQKVQVSFVKELVTNASFTARRAYERVSDRYDLRQTFFSASNFDNVLKDSSGNRRYVIWDMPKIDWSYSSFCDPDQLRAQYFSLYKAGYRMGTESAAWIRSFNAEETPEDPLVLAVEMYLDEVRKMTAPIFDLGAELSRGAADVRSKDWLSNEDVREIITRSCKIYQISEARFRQELKRRGLSKRSNGTWFANITRIGTNNPAVLYGHNKDKISQF